MSRLASATESENKLTKSCALSMLSKGLPDAWFIVVLFSAVEGLGIDRRQVQVGDDVFISRKDLQ
jgi:hypothetical protein